MKLLFITSIVISQISNCISDVGKDRLYDDMFKCLKDNYSSEIYDFTTKMEHGHSIYHKIVDEINGKKECHEFSIIKDYLKAVKSVSTRYKSKYTLEVNYDALNKAFTAAYGNARGYPKCLIDYAKLIQKNYDVYSDDDNVTPLTDDILTTVYIRLYKLAVIGGNYKALSEKRPCNELSTNKN